MSEISSASEVPPEASVAGASSLLSSPAPRDRIAIPRQVLLLVASSTTMALGIVSLYVTSYWSYAAGSTCVGGPGDCQVALPRTGVPIYSADQTVVLAIVALCPLLVLAGSRWPLKLIARSSIVAVPISAMASLLVQPFTTTGAISNGPFPAWSWLLAIPVVCAGGALGWVGLGSQSGDGGLGYRYRWGIPLEAVWAGVVGMGLVALVVWPERWLILTGSAAIAGLLLTIASAASRIVDRPLTG